MYRLHSISFDLRDARAPAKFHALSNRVVHKKLVQLQPPERYRICAAQIRERRMVVIRKPDSMEGKCDVRRNGYSQRVQGDDALGQDSFSARFINRRRAGIQNGYPHSVFSGRNSGGYPCRSRPDNDNLRTFNHT